MGTVTLRTISGLRPKSHLEDLGNGLFKYNDVYFILTSEISSITEKVRPIAFTTWSSVHL